MPFENRSEAGQKLARALSNYKDQHPVILALPRGGVPVAAEVATTLNAPLDLILVRKIGVPFQPELAMAQLLTAALRSLCETRTLFEVQALTRSNSRPFAMANSPKSSGGDSDIWAAANA